MKYSQRIKRRLFDRGYIKPNGQTRVEILTYLIKTYGNFCQICGGSFDKSHDKETSIDHIVPIGYGGTWHPYNLRVTHRICNEERGLTIDTRENEIRDLCSKISVKDAWNELDITWSCRTWKSKHRIPCNKCHILYSCMLAGANHIEDECIPRKHRKCNPDWYIDNERPDLLQGF